MTLMVVAHPIAGFTGRVAVEEFGLAFVGGFTGPLDVPTNIQSQLTAAGFTLNATPGADYGPKYVTHDELEDTDSAASVLLRAAFVAQDDAAATYLTKAEGSDAVAAITVESSLRKRRDRRVNAAAWDLAADGLTRVITATGLTVAGGYLAASVGGTDGIAWMPWWNPKGMRATFRVKATKATVGSRSTVGVANVAATTAPGAATATFEWGYVQGVGISLFRGSDNTTSNVIVADSAITDGTEYDLSLTLDNYLSPQSAGNPNQARFVCRVINVTTGADVGYSTFNINRAFYPTVGTLLATTNVAAGGITSLKIAADVGATMALPAVLDFPYSATVTETAFFRLPARPNGRLVIAMHGHGSNPIETGWTSTNYSPTWAALEAAGYTVAVPNMGGNLWGNPAALALVRELRDAAVQLYGLDERVFLWGTSMGSGAALTAIANDTFGEGNVAAAYLAQAVTDLSVLWANPSFTTLPAAYNNDATLRDASNPIIQPAADFAGVPLLFAASTGDTTAIKSQHTDAMVAHIGSATFTQVMAASGNHNDPSHYRPNTTLNFFGAYA